MVFRARGARANQAVRTTCRQWPSCASSPATLRRARYGLDRVLSSLLLLATLQTFDVAALKENKSGETTGQFGGPASRFTATNVPALQFILYAYEVREFQIEGGPNWIKTDRYDINASAERCCAGCSSTVSSWRPTRNRESVRSTRLSQREPTSRSVRSCIHRCWIVRRSARRVEEDRH